MSKLEMITNYFSVSLLCGVALLFMSLFIDLSSAWIVYPLGSFTGLGFALFCIHGSMKKDTWEPDPFIFFGTKIMYYISVIVACVFIISCVIKGALVVELVVIVHLVIASVFFFVGIAKKSIKT
jgi:hypothetical protein